MTGLFSKLPGANRETVPDAKYTPNIERDMAEQREADEIERTKENTSFTELIGAAAADGTIGYLDRAYSESKVRARPGDKPFLLTDDHFKLLEERGVEQEQWSLFERATSQEHFDFLYGIAVENMETKRTRAQFGMLANMAADSLDPGMFAIDAVAAPLSLVGKGTRAIRAAKGGAYAAAMAGTATLMTGEYNPEVDNEDVLIAAGTGFLFGGALSSLTGGAGRGAKAADEPTVSPSKIKEVAGKDQIAAFDESLSAAKVSGGYADAPDPTPGLAPLRNETDAEMARLDAAMSEQDIRVAFASARRDISARLNKMASPLTRYIGRKLTRDGVGYTDREAVVEVAASELSKRHVAVLDTQFRSGINEGWAQYKKANGPNALSRQEFHMEVGRAVRGDTDVSPEAIRTATAVRNSLDKTLKLAVDSGLEGFDDVRATGNYLPRMFSPEGYTRVFGAKGLIFEDVLEQVVKPAMRSAWEKRAPKVSEANRIEAEAEFTAASSASQQSTAKLTKLSEKIEGLEQKLKEAEAAPPKVPLDAEKLHASVSAKLKSRADAADQKLKALWAGREKALRSYQERIDTLKKAIAKREQSEPTARNADSHARILSDSKERLSKLEAEASAAEKKFDDGIKEAHGDREARRRAFNDHQRIKPEPVAAPDREAALAKKRAEVAAEKERLNKLQEKHKELIDAEARAYEKHTKMSDLAARQAIDDELLHEVASAWLKRGQRVLEGTNDEYIITALNLSDLAQVERLLLDNGAPAAKVAGIIDRLKQRADLNELNPNARPRVDMDENFRTVVKTEDGREVEMALSELLENDIEKIVPAFNQEISGWAALNEKLGVQNQGQLDRLRNQIKAEATKYGDDVNATLKLFDITTKAIRGQSTEADPLSFGSRVGRVIRNNNFIRSMGQVGFSMVADFGTVLAYAGFKNTLKSMPSIPELFTLLRNGQMDTSEAKLLNELFAPGTEWLRSPAFYRESTSPTSLGYGSKGIAKTALNAIDNASEWGKYHTSVLSGMAPVHTLYQRIAARANLLTLMDLAKSGKITAAQRRRLRNYGLSEEAQKNLFSYIKQFDSIDKIDPDKVDFKTREAMANYLSRATRHQILEADVGDSMELMHSAVGKIIFQFRTFMNTSYTRHMLYAANNLDDWRSYSMLVTTTAMAGGGWAVRQYLNTMGDEEKRKEVLTQENFVKSALQQSVWSAYIPLVVDTWVSDIRGNEAVFRYGRSTGLESGVMGNPTIDAMTKMIGGTKTLADAVAGDREVSQKQANDLWKLFWFNNLTGVRNIANEAIDNYFPEKDDDSAEIRAEDSEVPVENDSPLPFIGE